MLDLGWPELFIIVLVALLIVGPKELPGLVRTAASWLRKTKRSINNFQNSIEEIAREVELENVKKDAEELLDEAEKILIENMPIIPLYTYVRSYQLSPDVKGYNPHILDHHHPKFIYLERD